MTDAVTDEDPRPSAPDGRPWRKSCEHCALRRDNPQNLTDDDFDWMYLQQELGGFTFVCAHRDDGGFLRACAAWSAIQVGRRLRREHEEA